jgi:hypothetical protein
MTRITRIKPRCIAIRVYPRDPQSILDRKVWLQIWLEFEGDGAAFLSSNLGCHAGLYRKSLHEIYVPRIQRGNAGFAANVLGARGALLSVLIHFFEHGRWGSPVEAGVEGQRLTPEDQLFILMQAGYTCQLREASQHRRRKVVASAQSPCVIRLIVLGSCPWR